MRITSMAWSPTGFQCMPNTDSAATTNGSATSATAAHTTARGTAGSAAPARSVPVNAVDTGPPPSRVLVGLTKRARSYGRVELATRTWFGAGTRRAEPVPFTKPDLEVDGVDT